MAHGLITLLDDQRDREVKDIWRELKSACGPGWLVQRVPFPHFSWLVCGQYDETLALAAMKRIAARAKPIEVKVTALGVFTGERPVLYASITRTAELSTLHSLIWQEMRPALTNPMAYYEPPNWMPHITLAEGDLTQDTLACAMRALAGRNFYWQFRADTLVWAHDTGNAHDTHELRHKVVMADGDSDGDSHSN